jgi:hypothetical protein
MSDMQVWVQGATQAVTAVVAVVALVVSTISLYLQRRDKRPLLKIRGSIATLYGSDNEPVENVYWFDVANIGQIPATVTQIYVWDKPDWKWAFQDLRGQSAFPCKLEPGEGAGWWVNYEVLREVLRRNGHRGKVRVKLEARDATGGSHTERTKITLNAPWWRRVFGG